MKMSKRIFVCLVVLALSVSLFAMVGSAAGNEGLKYHVGNHKTVLEYYEEPIIFGYAFDDLDAVASGYTNDQLVNVNVNNQSLTTISIVDGGSGDKHLTIKGGANPALTTPTYLNWNAAEGDEIDDFNLEFDILMKNNMPMGAANLIFSVFVCDSAVTSTDIVGSTPVGTNLFKFDFNKGNVQYYDPAVAGSVTTASAGIAANTEYHVAIEYSVVNSKVSLTVTLASDGSAVYSLTDVALPTEKVGSIRLGSAMLELAFQNQIDLDNVIASGGSFTRLEENKIPDTERAIADFLTICESDDYTVADKVAVLSTGLALINEHGFVGTTDEAKANVLALNKVGVQLFANKLSECLFTIVEGCPYDQLVEHVTSYKLYADLIPADYSFMGDDAAAITAVIEKYNAKYNSLEQLKTDSEALIAALSDAELTNTNVRNYGYLKPYYDAVVNLQPYAGYPGVDDLCNARDVVIERFEALDAKAKAFHANVLAGADTTATFGTRFAAYTAANENYFDDAAYDGIDAILATYNALKDEMTVAINVCDHFILNVRRAEYSQYLSAKKSALDAASRGAYEEGTTPPADNAQLDLINAKYLEYPGITEAIELYNALKTEVATNEAAALAYVAAVNDIVAKLDTMTQDQLRAALASAEELQKTGNVIGVDGVTEANIVLNNIKSTFELTEGYMKQFTSVVAKLDAAKTAAERFDLAIEAFAVINNANKYDGVDSADKAKLDANVSDYNAKIQALNAGFVEANNVACNLVSASSGSPTDDSAVGRVIALIKKFYE